MVVPEMIDMMSERKMWKAKGMLIFGIIITLVGLLFSLVFSSIVEFQSDFGEAMILAGIIIVISGSIAYPFAKKRCEEEENEKQ